jgi:hypothetical protein
MKPEPFSNVELLADWKRRVRESQFAHYNAAKPLIRANYLLGVPVTILTTFVGTSLFATIEKQAATNFRLSIAFISVTAAVLASMQTFLRFSERAEKHRGVAARYGSLRRDIEALQAGGAPFDQTKLDTIREKLNSISTEAPEISEGVWTRTEKILKDRAKRDKAEEK